MTSSSQISRLSLSDSNALKGVALLFLLCHHLFYKPNGLYDEVVVKGHLVMLELGALSKVCVAIFVFLSGYGLMIQTLSKEGTVDWKAFFVRRFKKLFLNYWLIWLIFVPISYFCFDMTFTGSYRQDVGAHLFTDLLGIHSLVFCRPGDVTCYNPTWWFYACIILLYVLFPLLYRLVRRDALLAVLAALVISLLPLPFLQVIRFYIIAFVFGMMMVITDIPSPARRLRYLYLPVLALLMFFRTMTTYPLLIDCFITLGLVQVYRAFSLPAVLSKGLVFLGKHSMNIFLFHTFIFYFWFRDFIYASRNPLIIFLTLLVVCVIISMLLEQVKKYTVNKLL